MNRGNFVTRLTYSIKHLSPVGKVILAVGIFLVVSIPFVLSFYSTKESGSVLPQKPTPTLFPFPEASIVPDQLIIMYSEGSSPEDITDPDAKKELQKALNEIGVVSQKKLYNSSNPQLKNSYIFEFKQGTNLQEAAQRLHLLPEIVNAEANAEVKLF